MLAAFAAFSGCRTAGQKIADSALSGKPACETAALQAPDAGAVRPAEFTTPAGSEGAAAPGAESPDGPLRLPDPAERGEVVDAPPPRRLGVEALVAEAIASHPRVGAARARYAAASWRPVQARSLEDPLLSNNFFPISDHALQTAGGRAGNTLSVSQKYPWPEKRDTRAAIASREAQMAAARLRAVELEIEELVRLAYYELWFADRAIRIGERNREIAAELVHLAEARNAAGGSRQDVLRAAVQVDNLDNRLIELRQQKALAQADLAALLRRPDAAGIEPSESVDCDAAIADRDALFAAAVGCNPELIEARWAASRDRQQQRLACLAKRPDFVVGAAWQTITESDAVSPVANGHDNVSLSVGVTLPIWRDRIDAGIREASASAAASSRDYHAKRDDALREIRRIDEQIEAAKEQLRLYEERFAPRAKQALELAAADYRGRLVGFGEVTDGFSEVLLVELQAARVEATLCGLVAQLRRAVGCDLLPPAEGERGSM
ncbi:TolC family protein [Botrimarina sp.]|uniref:TolC family protein n=1 Tax=Botrimarina sp. TaxID=2795802 RepID=UPI0032EC6AC8